MFLSLNVISALEGILRFIFSFPQPKVLGELLLSGLSSISPLKLRRPRPFLTKFLAGFHIKPAVAFFSGHSDSSSTFICLDHYTGMNVHDWHMAGRLNTT